jgi:hypothetical protein
MGTTAMVATKIEIAALVIAYVVLELFKDTCVAIWFLTSHEALGLGLNPVG